MLSRRAVTELALLAVALPACTLRCGDNTLAQSDAGGSDARAVFDGGDNGDAAAPLTRVDFAIGGCDELDDSGCRGAGPLALTFAAITSSPVQVYLWQFGDGATSTKATPTHTYASPGLYTISLDVEGPGGGLGISKPDWIAVAPAPLGAACTTDTDCASATCICDADDGDCLAPLAGRGLCAAACDGASPCTEGTCVDLGPGSPPAPQDWQQPLCLPDCAGGCLDGLLCRSLLGDDGALRSACFVPGPLADLGESCRDADGVLRDDRCASGQCLDVGARGLCGFDCASASCPDDAACASFAGALGSQCVRECGPALDCDDPWLDCEQPGNPGAGGFTIAGAPAASGYCAPRFCGDDASECDPDGICAADYCEAP